MYTSYDGLLQLEDENINHHNVDTSEIEAMFGVKAVTPSEITPEQAAILDSLEDPDEPEDPKTKPIPVSEELANHMVGSLLTDSKFLAEASAHLRKEIFIDTALGFFAVSAKQWREYDTKSAPPRFYIEECIRLKINLKPDAKSEEREYAEKQRTALMNVYEKLVTTTKPEHVAYCRSKLMRFVSDQQAYVAMKEFFSDREKGKEDALDVLLSSLAAAKGISTCSLSTAILTADEFEDRANNETNTWIIRDAMHDQTLTIFSGKPFCGKTYAVRMMIAKLIEGKPFFNWETAQTPVLYINADRNRLRKTRDEIKRNLSPEGAELFRKQFFAADMEVMPDKFDVATLESLANQTTEMLKANGSWQGRLLVIIDTFRAAFLCGAEQGAESDSAAMVTLLKPLKALVKKLGVCFLVIHHDPKHSTGAAGSGAIPGTTDQVWGYTREKGSQIAEFSLMTRDGDYPSFKVARDDAGFLSVVDDSEIDLLKLAEKTETKETEILETCSAVPFGEANAIDKFVIQKRLYGDPAIKSIDTVVRRLRDAERPGKIPRLEKVGKGSKADPYRWFRVG